MRKITDKYTIILFLLLTFNIILAQQNPIDSTQNNTKIDTIKVNKNKLNDVLDYKAQEIQNNFRKKMSYLIEKAEVKYQDYDIFADYISIDWETGEVYGRGKIDSTGKITENVNFIQGGKTYEYNEFKFNFKNKKGQAFGVRTEEGEGVIVAEKTKKANDSVFYMRRGLYTTDEYFIDKKDSLADYHLKTGKIKYIDKSSIITGPIQMYIEQVPTPLVMPFFYLPEISKNRSAGILIPSFGERESQGFYLQGLGYYTPIGDNFDLTLKTDLYTKGSWAIYSSSTYYKRYKYKGNFSANYTTNISGIKGLSGYSKTALYRIQWSHQQDPKANPNLTFSSSVNFMSSKFYSNGINNGNIFNANVLQNTANSSISINKIFPNSPFNASLSLSHNQNNSTQTMNFNLPQFSLNMSRIYPFAPKVGSKQGLLENLNMNYSLNIQNNLSEVPEKDVFTSRMFNNARNGMQHKLNFATNNTLFNYFTFSLGANYTDVGVLETVEKHYDEETSQVVTEKVNGFKTYRTFGFNSSLSTQLFGFLNFGKDKKIQAIRHVLTPSVGYSLTPDFSKDFWNYYDSYIDGNGNEIKYSYFDGGLYGSPGNRFSSSVNFSLNNNLEMKVLDSKSDSTNVKKIKLFDNLSLNTSYNIAAEEFKWSPISVNGSTSLFKSKLRMNFTATVNPYKIEYTTNNNVRSGSYVDEFGYFSLSRYNVSMNYNLNSSDVIKTKPSSLYKKKGTIRNEVFYFDDENYAHFDQSWNLGFGLIYNYAKNLSGSSNLKETTASVRINGSIKPTPYWTISGSTNYDITNDKLAFTTFTFSRDLRSFNINFSWVPFGTYKTWNFFIGIKANILKDAVKYEQRNFPQSSTF